MSETHIRRLFETILSNEADLLETCISEAVENGVDINKKQSAYRDRTPLEYAVYSNRSISVETLISRGANVSSGHSGSLITHCLRVNNPDMAKYLIQKGADISQPDIAGKTALYWAISKENEDCVKIFLKNVADLTTCPYIIDAVDKGNLKIVQLLLRKGASANFQDNNGLTPLLKCIRKHNSNFTIFDKLLHHNADINLTTKQGTVLLKATEMGKRRLVRKILERGADVNKSSDDGLYPIMVAIGNSNYYMVKLLVDSGADLAVSDSRGDSPLLKAAGGNNLRIVQYLVNAGADLNKVNNFHETALFRAISHSNYGIYDFLVNEGADERLTVRESILIER